MKLKEMKDQSGDYRGSDSWGSSSDSWGSDAWGSDSWGSSSDSWSSDVVKSSVNEIPAFRPVL